VRLVSAGHHNVCGDLDDCGVRRPLGDRLRPRHSRSLRRGRLRPGVVAPPGRDAAVERRADRGDAWVGPGCGAERWGDPTGGVRGWRVMRISILVLLAVVGATPGLAQTPIVDESEPNDNVRTADSVALGDQARGVVNPAGDVDTWFVDLPAGQFLSVDVDAAQVGSPLDGT